MKSYLSLIPISAKVHRRQNRMTFLCIVFAVFLVTAVFSMAEMGVRMERTRLLDKHGALNNEALWGSAMGRTLFLIAGALFVLILIAGVLMISSTINSNVAQRIKFFGMMRCIGMSRRQIIRFVRLEALNWCKRAIPTGIVLGVTATWGLCAALRLLVGGEFSDIPIFGVSMIGIVSGVTVGIVTVLIAAGAPAKRAAQVSPVAAVSGNSESAQKVGHAVNTRFFSIQTALGVHHAVSGKKNLILMTGSFALGIILFLSFSVLIAFINCVMPQSAADSDLNISSGDGSNTIAGGLLATIDGMEGVKRVYGRRSSFAIPADTDNEAVLADTVDLISYDPFELECLKKDRTLKWGSDLAKVYGNSNYALAAWDKDSPLKIGDKIRMGEEQLEIAGLLKFDPFNDDGLTNGKITLITSSETFARLTGITDYSLVMIQTAKGVTDEEVAAISNIVGENYRFSDRREQRTAGIYLAFVFCVYGFLGIITLVAILNIINSISMSVSARIKQYGAMRAVGMDMRQMTRMIAAEAFTYALSGCVTGCVIGLMISKLLYDALITAHFPYAVFRLPVGSILLILAIVFGAAALAVYGPAKRIRNISVTETINEL